MSALTRWTLAAAGALVGWVILAAACYGAPGAPAMGPDPDPAAARPEPAPPGDLHLQWTRDLPARKPAWEHTFGMPRDVGYEPVVAGGLVLVGCEHNGAVLALDLATGTERWRFYTGGPVRLAPVADADRIYVASEDGHLYCLDRQGRRQWAFRGGPADRRIVAHDRLASVWPISAQPALADGKVFVVAGYWPVDGIFIHALDARTGAVAWSYDAARFRPNARVRVVENVLHVTGHGGRDGRGGAVALEIRTGQAVSAEKAPPLAPAAAPPTPPGVEGKVTGVFAAAGHVLCATAEGRLYCFGEREVAPQRHAAAPEEPAADASLAERILQETAAAEGWCVVAGLEDGALVEGLLRRSRMHLVAVEADEAKADAVRRALDSKGLFDDHRLSVIAAEPEAAGLPPYLASLMVSETGRGLTDALAASLRPYGGTFVAGRGPALRLTKREGAPAGADDWTHEFGDAGNSLSSRDTLAKAPLGVLWYGGVSAAARYNYNGEVFHDSMPHGVSPLPPNVEVVEGRQIMQGPGVLVAVDIYTGRIMWETALPKQYVWGGLQGALGIHSKKHPEPWKYPEALQAEVPVTQTCRASGFNYASAPDSVYVAAGRRLLRFAAADGKALAAWAPPVEGDLCWGSVRVLGDVLVATLFPPQNIIDAKAGHDGNGGDFSKDRMAMTRLVALDRQSGRLLWKRDAAWGFLNQGFALGADKVFCVDLLTEGVLTCFREAGRTLPDAPPMLYALDLKTGAVAWSAALDVCVKQLTYSKERDILVAPCRNLLEWKDGAWAAAALAKGGRSANVGKMRGYRGADGHVLWEVAEAAYFEPHILVGDLVIDRYGWTYDLLSGKRHERQSPLTGQSEPWNFSKGGCTHLVGSDGLVTWRTGFYDLAGGSGSMALAGMDAGCSPTFIPAGGVLSGPNFGTHYKKSKTTALALVHRPDNELWTEYGPQRAPVTPGPILRAGYNFGAPGDRLAPDGTLWLAVSAQAKPNVTLEPADAAWFTLHTSRTGSFVASCGVQGAARISLPTHYWTGKQAPKAADQPRRFTVRLHFAEPDAAKPGERILSVGLEGKPVLRDFDVMREAGGRFRPVVREFRGVEVAGSLDVDLSASKGRTLLCGVEMIAE